MALPTGIFVESTGDYRFDYVMEVDALVEIAKTKALDLDQMTQ